MATEGRCIHPVTIERVRTTVSLEDIRHDIDALDDQIVRYSPNVNGTSDVLLPTGFVPGRHWQSIGAPR